MITSMSSVLLLSTGWKKASRIVFEQSRVTGPRAYEQRSMGFGIGSRNITHVNDKGSPRDELCQSLGSKTYDRTEE